MNTFKNRNGIKVFFQFLLLGCVIILFVLAINNLIPGSANSAQFSGYPPPEQQPTLLTRPLG
jgi:large-conductance mechanosensitive channel